MKYNVGEEITFTAHVKNLGFADSKSFKYRWFVDDKEKSNGSYDKAIKELAKQRSNINTNGRMAGTLLDLK